MIASPGFSSKFYMWTRILIKVVLVAVFCIMVFNYFNAAFQSVVINERERAKRVANSMELHLQGRLMALKLLSNAPNIRNMDEKFMNATLDQTVKLLGFTNAFVFDPSGNIIGSATEPDFTQKYRQEESFQMSLKGSSAISDRINMNDIHDAFISLSVPIYSQNKIIGVLSAGVPINEIANLAMREQVSYKQYVYVMDNKSQFVYHPRLNDIYPEDDKYRPHLVNFFTQPFGDLVTNSFLDGVEKLYVYTSVKDTNWRVVAAIPMSVVYQTVIKQSSTDILFVLLLVISIGFLYNLLRQAKRCQEEREAMRMERLMSVNQMAAGMAHEIRNPLTSIKGFIQLLQRKAQQPPSQSYLDIIFTEIERIEKLTNEFQMLAKPLKLLKMQKIDLTKNISDVIVLIDAQAANKGISVGFKQIQGMASNANEHYYVRGDEAQLKQVWLNLLRNAIEATNVKGQIEVCLSVQGTQAVVQIKDNGIGIPNAVISKLGTPFFTTKDTGTGLGLTVCYNIIESHEGKMRIDSKEGEGTVFRVFLPLMAELINSR